MPFWHFFGWGGHLENWGRILTPFFGPKYKKFVTPGGYPPPIDDHVTQRTPPQTPTRTPPYPPGPLSTYYKPTHKGAGQTATLIPEARPKQHRTRTYMLF